MRTLDLRGEVCPYTFLRSKLALEEMDAGQDLLILLDHPAAFHSVPRALREDGHELVSVEITPDGRGCAVRTRKHG